jgi:hypothetical protein
MLDVIDMNAPAEDGQKRQPDDPPTASITKFGLKQEISKRVVRKKLAKQRHLVIEKGIKPEYLDSLFPDLLSHFDPQVVNVSFLSTPAIFLLSKPSFPSSLTSRLEHDRFGI